MTMNTYPTRCWQWVLAFVALMIGLTLLARNCDAQTVIYDSPIGFVSAEGNELTIGAKNDDADKLRLTQPITEHGGGGGVISFNLHKSLGQVVFGQRQVEMAMIRVEQSSDVRGTFLPKGEFNFFANDGGEQDSNMRRAFSFTWNEVTYLQPGIAAGLAARIAPFLPTSGAGNGTVLSPDGRFMLAMQGDGNLVVYRWDVDHWTATWSIWTGPIQ